MLFHFISSLAGKATDNCSEACTQPCPQCIHPVEYGRNIPPPEHCPLVCLRSEKKRNKPKQANRTAQRHQNGVSVSARRSTNRPTRGSISRRSKRQPELGPSIQRRKIKPGQSSVVSAIINVAEFNALETFRTQGK